MGVKQHVRLKNTPGNRVSRTGNNDHIRIWSFPKEGNGIEYAQSTGKRLRFDLTQQSKSGPRKGLIMNASFNSFQFLRVWISKL